MPMYAFIPYLVKEQTSYATAENESPLAVYRAFHPYLLTHACYPNSVCSLPILARAWSWGKGFINRTNDTKM